MSETGPRLRAESTRPRVLCVVGTRPEAIKMAPVVERLRAAPDLFDVRVMVTAQHRALLDQALRIFDIRPDVDLNIMTERQTLSSITQRVLAGMESYFVHNPTDLVLAQGDTTTVMAASMACFYAGVPFGHVEAGLRTGDYQAPYPEEYNRRVVSLASDYHFAPTEQAGQNLLREGVPESRVFVTGNPVVDALLDVLRRTEPPPKPIPADAPYVLLTCHRRESFGEPIREIFGAVRTFAESRPDLYVWYPVHPNPNVREPADEILGKVRNVFLSEPLDYVAFAHAMHGALLILSDSGGVQEEAPSLGKPVLVLRDVTERPEAVTAGTCRLVGADRGRILSNLAALLDDAAEYRAMSERSNPFGDGDAAERIVAILAEHFPTIDTPRPRAPRLPVLPSAPLWGPRRHRSSSLTRTQDLSATGQIHSPPITRAGKGIPVQRKKKRTFPRRPHRSG
ncbi:MAG: UDP-N-acetylglucosamine 2-epimerase (non-hydrolyzing) [Kiritimatiellae bacterium]|nr:UDP-N-acetylglucosamine 2-epimerase (non-hydrolyzing) [Kiritimatiellia bacterium]